jgi:hypothetical protein
VVWKRGRVVNFRSTPESLEIRLLTQLTTKQAVIFTDLPVHENNAILRGVEV